MTSEIGITNKTVIEKFKENGKTACVEWLMGKASHMKLASKRSYEHLVEKTVKGFQRQNKSKKINKNYEDRLSSFLNEPVKLPTPTPHLQKEKQVDVDNACSEICKKINYKFARDIICLQGKQGELKDENETLKINLKKLKKTRCQKSTLLTLKSKLKHQVKVNKTLSQRVQVKTKTLKRLRLQQNRLINKYEKLRNENTSIKSDLNTFKIQVEDLENKISQLRSNLNDKSTDLDNTIAENEWLADIVQKDNEVLSFFDPKEGMYTYELRECLYTLLSLNVSASKCSKVIECVLNLVNKTVEKLPSRSTILNLNTERLIMSQTQMSELLPENKNLTIYTDETTKFGQKFSGYHVSDTEGNMYVLGLRELVSKSGKDTLSCLKEILADIETSAIHSDLVAKKILYNISATMSDRASTEHTFNALLKELRTTVLPELHTNWHDLTQENQNAVSELLNFFCGLHSLVHFAEVSNRAILEAEKGFFEDQPPIHDKNFLKANESGSLRLVRTASKALSRGGDEKSGKYGDFSIYAKQFLKENGMSCVPLVDFHGNRFNILFESSATLFFLKTIVTEFLQCNQSNNLLKAVSCDIKVKEYLAGCKALGLVSRLITGPLWCLLENKTIHIMEMNLHYLELTTFLTDANIQKLMDGSLEIFSDATVVNKDPIFESLIQPWEHDYLVEVLLGVILPALGELCKRLFSDHLPGGKWANVTEELRRKSSSTQKHNKFAESVFGFVDNLLRHKPNISALASEAYIMYSANKTAQWLESKDSKEKKLLVEKACKNASIVKKQFQVRKNEIEARKRETIEESRRRAEDLEKKRIARLQTYTDKIIYFGLWQSEHSVDEMLQGISKKSEKKEALKAQLNFRRYVLKQQTGEKDIYLFSKNGKDLSLEDLTIKVKLLVKHAFTIQSADPVDKEQHTPILVGKHVRHKFQAETGFRWWQGKVISQVPGYPNWYNIIYEGDTAVYSYQLLQDWKEGLLEIVVV